MRYCFDIHLLGKTELDDQGQEFRSLRDAREHAVATGRICLAESRPRERALLRQCIIEITNPDGVSDLVPLTDCLPRRHPSGHLALQAA